MPSKANFLYCVTKKMDGKELSCVWILLVRFGAALRLQSTILQEWPWEKFKYKGVGLFVSL